MTTSTLSAASAALDALLRGTTTTTGMRIVKRKKTKTKKTIRLADDELNPEQRLQRQLDEKRKAESVAKLLKNSSKLGDAEIAILEMREEKMPKKKNKKKRKAVEDDGSDF